jgi:hypothetical protein
MKLRWGITAIVAAAFAFAVGCNHMHKSKEKDEEDEGDEVKMTMDQVPPAVRATLMQQAGGAMIKSVDQEHPKSGKIVYETDVMQNGKNWEIRVAEDGTLISKKIDNEEAEKSNKKKEDKEDDEKEEHK